MNYRHLAFVGLSSIALAGTLLVSVACGDDDSTSGSSSNAFDPAKADPLAHGVLPTEKDLPGSGWTVSKTDKFDDSSASANTAACKDIDAKKAAAKAKSDPNRSGRAEKEYTQDGKGPLPTTVEFEVNVFKDSATPADSLKAFQDAVKSSNFETCLKDTIADSGGSGVKIDIKSATPSTSAPNSGVAAAYDFTITVQGQAFNLRYETYVWQYSNTGNTVTIGGGKDDVTAALVKGAVDKTVANLKSPPK